jgi:hypothetical protein
MLLLLGQHCTIAMQSVCRSFLACLRIYCSLTVGWPLLLLVVMRWRLRRLPRLLY